MKIGKIWYPVHTLGYGNRLGIWLQGCHKCCDDCISPEMQPLDGGTEIQVSELIDLILTKCPGIDGVTISGGEPFLQAEELLLLVNEVQKLGIDDILIFTGYTYVELMQTDKAEYHELLNKIAVLVDGEYVKSLNNGKGLRGSSNQKIYIFKYPERYETVNDCERRVQFVLDRMQLWMIGIPEN